MNAPARPSRILFLSSSPPGSWAGRNADSFRAAGWEVLHAGDEVEALAAVRRKHVDLALVHRPMDEVASMDFARVLRGVSSTEFLPVVVLAAGADERECCEYLDAGADDVLAEGTSPAEMIARVGALLRVKELHDQLAASRAALRDALDRERQLMAKLRRDNAQLRQEATTDPLTHAQNVRSFRDLLGHEFRGAKRYNTPLSLLMLDVDHFKVVNDTHGHPSGDYVLKELAVILKKSVRESDVVARTGGEEFCVLLPKAGLAQAGKFADRIRGEVFRREFIVYDQHIHVTVSIGLASYPEDVEVADAEMLMYFADQALLTAKENGRDRVVTFHAMPAIVRRRLRQQYLATPEEEPDSGVPSGVSASV